MEQLGRTFYASPIRRFLFRFGIIWLLWLLPVAFCFRNTHVAFLKAESGYYQADSRSAPPPHFKVLRRLFTRSYNGHYTPLAFYGEFELTYLLGPREPFWRWRQVAVVAFLASSFSLLVHHVARIHHFSRENALAAAAGLSALFVFQPLMQELFAWPFMVFQLIALSLSVLTLLVLVQGMQTPARKSWIWLAAVLAYSSMHVIGFGLVTVLATSAIFAACLAGIYCGKLKEFVPVRRTLLTALPLLLVVAAAHSLCMQMLRVGGSYPPAQASVHTPSLDLGFCFLAFSDMLQALISFNPPPSFTSVTVVQNLWPWGLFVFTLAISLLFVRARSCLAAPSTERLTRFTLYSFSLMAFGAFLFMAVARHFIDFDPNPIYDYLFGARYLVCGNFLLSGGIVALIISAVRPAGRGAAVLFLLLGFVALLAGEKFGATTYRQIDPHANVSHAKAWRSLVSLTRECRAAGLCVPNVPLQSLAEFDTFDLKVYEPLLRYSLRLAPTEKIEFEPWTKIHGAELVEYQKAAPSFHKVIQLLKLQPPRT